MNQIPAVLDGGTRILIVDDERMNRTLLEVALSRSGYATVTAEDGLTAWELLDATPDAFDVILLDRRMPRMNGMELLTRIRADDRLKYLPVVMQTASTSTEDVVEGIKAGVFYYLAKPLNLQLMLSVVAQAVDERQLLRRLQDDLAKHSIALTLLDTGVFHFRTPEEGNMLAVALAHICPGSRNLMVGLSEIFTNAVEHGNLSIKFQEKSRLLEEQRWSDEIARRLTLPEYAGRRASVTVERQADRVNFIVCDQGEGFEWRDYMDIQPARAFSAHGRGIAMARRMCFDRMEYRGRGNEVVCTVYTPTATATPPTEPPAPTFDGGEFTCDMALARTMQAGLLPSDRTLAELEHGTRLRISGVFHPSTDVGGDIWGVIPLDRHRVAIYLADFSGHGVTAALNTFRLDTLIRHMRADQDKPADYMTRLNREMSRLLPVGHFCAMLYGVVDTRISQFTYAAAAASRPLVMNLSSREVSQGDGKGLPLGISPSAVYEPRSLSFPPGSLLFLYSDALAEARRADDKAIGCPGVARLLPRMVEDGSATDAVSLVEAILHSSGDTARVNDDLTAVCCLRAADG